MTVDEMLSTSAIADPYSYLSTLRKDNPVYWNQRYRSWILTRYDDVAAALRDPRFSSDRISPVIARERRRQRPDLDLVQTLELLNGWLVFRDPPEHTRLRRLVAKAFSPRMVASMRDEVERITDQLLDAAELAGVSGQIDLLGSVAYPLPAIVIANMLGAPSQDREQFKRWSDDISALVFGALEDRGRHERARIGMSELVRYIGLHIDRVRHDPQVDLATALVEARESDEALTEEQIVAVCINLLFGGHETTTNLIANGILALLKYPDQADLLRADPSVVSTAVEEFLRYDGPAKAVVRVATETIGLRDRTILAGDRIFLMPSAANRDPSVFDRPDELDILRIENPHLGFGVGIHYCLGASLARLEASVAIPRILRRFPGLRLAQMDLEWHPALLTRGLTALPLLTGRS